MDDFGSYLAIGLMAGMSGSSSHGSSYSNNSHRCDCSKSYVNPYSLQEMFNNRNWASKIPSPLLGLLTMLEKEKPESDWIDGNGY